jgi:uncharacterized membrane protein YozB (DUF420 family)
MLAIKPARRWRYFFVAMACLILVVVFAGFAPSFYLRSPFTQDGSLSLLLHVHGIVFSAWIVLFLVQTLLIVRGSRDLHRRLGWLSAGLATAMLFLVAAATVEQFRRVPALPPPPVALSLNAFDIIVFGIFVSLAIFRRKQPEWHKRFLLSATLLLLGAPIFRLVILAVGDPQPELLLRLLVTEIAVLDLFWIPCIAYDLVTRRKLHPAYYTILPVILADQILTLSVISWQPWTDFANGLRRLVV